jgi:uncharacterized OB-fold protein
MSVGPVVRDDETATFFDGTAEGQFLLRACPEGHASSPHAQLCDTCGCPDLTWKPASGDASVVSWAVVPGSPGETGPGHPTILVVAELAEGPWWWSHIAEADLTTIYVGTPLTIRFERYDEGHEAVPVFSLA